MGKPYEDQFLSKSDHVVADWVCTAVVVAAAVVFATVLVRSIRSGDLVLILVSGLGTVFFSSIPIWLVVASSKECRVSRDESLATSVLSGLDDAAWTVAGILVLFFTSPWFLGVLVVLAALSLPTFLWWFK